MKATIIKQPALRLVTAKSKSFPEGNSEAFSSLESHLETLRGRRFYGLLYPSETGLEYHAGLVPKDEEEEREFVQHGFSVRDISGGSCARIKLQDWTEKTDQIGPAFASMMEIYEIDPSRPQMEFYRSLKELHLLLPVVLQPEPD